MADYILIADDDLEDQVFIEHALLDNGFTMPRHYVQDGDALLRHLGKNETVHPLFIVLDLNMPKINGMEALHYIKSKPALEGIPVYVLTTTAEKGVHDQALEIGATACFVKPNTYKELVQVISAIKVASK